jgi:tyrosine-protein phosphatase YwqE
MLPGVDDGSKSNEESLACLRVMHDAGFERVICTPHYQYPRFPNEESDILHRYDNMLLDFKGMDAKGIPQMKGVAGEYRVDSGFADRIKKEQFLLVGGKFLLTEFSLHQQVIGLDQVMFDLQMKNYEVILAHPERYPYYSSSSQALQKLKDMGVYFQINILSLIGFYGEGSRRKAFEMIEKGWVEFWVPICTTRFTPKPLSMLRTTKKSSSFWRNTNSSTAKWTATRLSKQKLSEKQYEQP